MATKYKDAIEELYNSSLTDDELLLINKLEGYIDNQIRQYFTDEDIRINIEFVNFSEHYIDRVNYYTIKKPRRKLMRKELDKRYKTAGWNVEEKKFGDGAVGQTYWVLTGKI